MPKAQHLLLFFLLSSASLFAQQAEFFLEKPEYKFPKTTEGEQLVHYYRFVNKGDKPLVITDSKVNCVCTRVQFPLKPVMPGQLDSIKVSFDTRSKSGYHDRRISIISNAASGPVYLRFKVFVRKKD